MNRHVPDPLLDRRAAAIAIAAVFGGALGARSLAPARAATGAGDDPFTLGVASGMPRPSSVLLWTRLAPRPHEPSGGMPDAPVAVRWEIAEDERFARGLRTGTAIARPAAAHSVHVEVHALPSDARLYYRFIVGDATSPVGRTRTAPADDADVAGLRVALASCQHFEQGSFAAHREIAARDLDFVLFVGDYIYESTNPRYRIRSHDAAEPRTLAAYRARHAIYKGDADLRAAHAAHPWVLTWDDHEVENDYAGEHGGAELSPQEFLQRRAAAYQAYFEHLPIAPPSAAPGAPVRIHDRYRWGRLAELWTLDARQYRSVQACGDDGRARGRVVSPCDALADPLRTVLGFDQEHWLADGLAASRRRWKLVAQGSQLSPAGVETPMGRRVYSDGWDGYPPARERLLAAIAGPPARDVLCLGGDVHRHVAAQLRLRGNDERSPIVAGEFVTTSVSSRGLNDVATALLRAANPDMLHARSDERGYALVDIDARRADCNFRSTPFPAAPDARLGTQARFVALSGRPGVQPA